MIVSSGPLFHLARSDRITVLRLLYDHLLLASYEDVWYCTLLPSLMFL